MQWHQVQAWAEEALKNARERNEGDLNEIDTAKNRGRIQTLKELLALPMTQTVMASQAKFVMPQPLDIEY